MKKLLKLSLLLIITMSLILFISSCNSKPIDNTNYGNDKYKAEDAVEYAIKYAETRNLEYPEFKNNCTNYVSQCLVEGGMTMDEGPLPEDNSDIIYTDTEEAWFMNRQQVKTQEPPLYSISSSFSNTQDFIDYWTGTRGYELKKYDNTFQGRNQLYGEGKLGDIFVYYDNEGNLVHIGILTHKDELSLYYCGNTTDRYKMSVNDIDNFVYPKFGVISL